MRAHERRCRRARAHERASRGAWYFATPSRAPPAVFALPPRLCCWRFYRARLPRASCRAHCCFPRRAHASRACFYYVPRRRLLSGGAPALPLRRALAGLCRAAAARLPGGARPRWRAATALATCCRALLQHLPPRPAAFLLPFPARTLHRRARPPPCRLFLRARPSMYSSARIPCSAAPLYLCYEIVHHRASIFVIFLFVILHFSLPFHFLLLRFTFTFAHFCARLQHARAHALLLFFSLRRIFTLQHEHFSFILLLPMRPRSYLLWFVLFKHELYSCTPISISIMYLYAIYSYPPSICYSMISYILLYTISVYICYIPAIYYLHHYYPRR